MTFYEHGILAHLFRLICFIRMLYVFLYSLHIYFVKCILQHLLSLSFGVNVSDVMFLWILTTNCRYEGNQLTSAYQLCISQPSHNHLLLPRVCLLFFLLLLFFYVDKYVICEKSFISSFNFLLFIFKLHLFSFIYLLFFSYCII